MYEFAVHVDLWSADARIRDVSIGVYIGTELVRGRAGYWPYDLESPVRGAWIRSKEESALALHTGLNGLLRIAAALRMLITCVATVLWSSTNLHMLLYLFPHLYHPVRICAEHPDHVSSTLPGRIGGQCLPFCGWRHRGRHVCETRQYAPAHMQL